MKSWRSVCPHRSHRTPSLVDNSMGFCFRIMYLMNDLDSFDWLERRPMTPAFKRDDPITMSDARYAMMVGGEPESPDERRLRMLRQLSLTCQACSMCELGRKDAEKGMICRDPHVFSTVQPSRFMVIGQNPGWHELEKREPFVGAAGANFNEEMGKHGFSRSDFYISNTIKCWTKGNSKPLACHLEACEPFLRMEVKILKPKIIIALGAVAFQALCPDNRFSDCLQQFSSSVYGKVYAIYHPSPMNLNDPKRRSMFNEQVRLLCGVMKRLAET